MNHLTLNHAMPCDRRRRARFGARMFGAGVGGAAEAAGARRRPVGGRAARLFLRRRHYTGEPGKEIMQGQIYVEVLAPKDVRRPYPLVLIHGAAQTATNWMGTPDGRKGWAEYFVEQGYIVYMIDQPMRGRSAWHPGDGATRMFTAEQEEFQFTANAVKGTWPQAKKHTQWPGEGPNKGQKGDPIFDAFYATQVETVIDNRRTQRRNQDAGAALLDKIGPAIVLTHSQSGTFGWLIADARPQLVKAIIAIEPSGPPFEATSSPPARRALGPDRHRDHLRSAGQGAERNRGRARGQGRRSRSVRLLDAEGAGAPARQPEEHPGMVMAAEASYHQVYDHCTAKYLNQAGVKTEYIRLQDKGIHGNGHMVMIEKNNLDIAKLVDDWVQTNVR